MLMKCVGGECKGKATLKDSLKEFGLVNYYDMFGPECSVFRKLGDMFNRQH